VSNDTLARQWQLLRMLPRYPQKVTARDLQRRLADLGYDTTKRTVERDLLSLSEMFAIQQEDRERPYGWSWQKKAPILDVPGLTVPQALSFELIQRFLQPLLPHSILNELNPYFDVAARQLATLPKGHGVPAWSNKIRIVHPAQSLLPPKIDPAAQANVYEALLHNRRLRIVYRKRDAKGPVEYVIHPLAIVQRGPVTYLVCTLFDYEDVLLLALHRILSAVMLTEAAKYPPGFDLDAYIGAGAVDFGQGSRIRLEVLFEKHAAEHLAETPLSGDQKVTAVDGKRVRVTATVAETPQLLWWLLALGSSVEVIKPRRLRQSLAATIAAANRQYRRHR
jgi:predicted DNA-binding transcriptional regulator YafY